MSLTSKTTINMSSRLLLLLVAAASPWVVSAKAMDFAPVLRGEKPLLLADASIRVGPNLSKSKLHSKFEEGKTFFRNGQLSRGQFWDFLDDIEDQSLQKGGEDLIEILQLASQLLYDDHFPISAALYAAQAIFLAKDPYGNEVQLAWRTLYTVSQEKFVPALLETVAKNTLKKSPVATAPFFDDNWAYYQAGSIVKEGKLETALDYYDKVRANSMQFGIATYEKALLLVEMNRINDAKVALSILTDEIHARQIAKNRHNKEIVNLAHLALGRINYEIKEFEESFRNYRQIEKTSGYYYDSLFEQGWAFFMAGYPNHALGALHAVQSPFFKKQFNPETAMLEALIYYWMCLYEDSRYSLRQFIEKYAEKVEGLNDFVKQRELSARKSYELFEDFISGVSPDSLGIAPAILQTAATDDSVMYLRAQYADLLGEVNRLHEQGVFGSKEKLARIEAYLGDLNGAIQRDIGTAFFSALTTLKTQYDELYTQGQFLLVELLMSEKEQVLGKELHADKKMSSVSSRNQISGWGGGTYSWTQDLSDEYWWDEVGNYIYRAKPQCNTID